MLLCSHSRVDSLLVTKAKPLDASEQIVSPSGRNEVSCSLIGILFKSVFVHERFRGLENRQTDPLDFFLLRVEIHNNICRGLAHRRYTMQVFASDGLATCTLECQMSNSTGSNFTCGSANHLFSSSCENLSRIERSQSLAPIVPK